MIYHKHSRISDRHRAGRRAAALTLAVILAAAGSMAGGPAVSHAAETGSTAAAAEAQLAYYRIAVTGADGSQEASFLIRAEEMPTISQIRDAVRELMAKRYGSVQKVSLREDRITIEKAAGEAVRAASQRKDAAPEGSSAALVGSMSELAQELAKSESLEVTAVQKKTTNKKISYRTVRKSSGRYRKGTSTVKAGKKGVRTLTYHVTWVNGKKTAQKLVGSKVTKKAKNRVVIRGTGTVSAPAGRKLSGTSGTDVAKFAKQYVGNPYVYGGCSLVSGADCSGFVMAVYSHFGVSMGHSAATQRAYGTGVSLKNAKPGDIICYPGHVGIYIGGGKLVHAMDPAHGIVISQIHYSGKPILTVRRVFA